MKNFITGTINKAGRTLRAFMKDEKGEVNLIAILLIIVVTVALVAIFKEQITNMVNGIFENIGEGIEQI